MEAITEAAAFTLHKQHTLHLQLVNCVKFFGISCGERDVCVFEQTILSWLDKTRCQFPHQLQIPPQRPTLVKLKTMSGRTDNLQHRFTNEAEGRNIDDYCTMVANTVAKWEEPCTDALDIWCYKAAVNLEGLFRDHLISALATWRK